MVRRSSHFPVQKKLNNLKQTKDKNPHRYAVRGKKIGKRERGEEKGYLVYHKSEQLIEISHIEKKQG